MEHRKEGEILLDTIIIGHRGYHSTPQKFIHFCKRTRFISFLYLQNFKDSLLAPHMREERADH